MCSLEGCSRKMFVAGYCSICKDKFCKMHRLPEKHNCATLSQHILQLQEKLQQSNEKNRCCSEKIIAI